ncbi:MAG: hypothetical protein RIR11_1000 [Bacteroidota bacterium]|jgi:hypothetical protein
MLDILYTYYRHFFTICFFTAIVLEVDAATPEKCIFYWGDMQSVLLQKNNYEAEISVSPHNFRKSMFSQPSLWNGKSLIRDFQFKFEQMDISVATNKEFFNQLIPILDINYAQTAKAGDQFIIENLPITDGYMGCIKITINKDTLEVTKQRYDFVDAGINANFKALDRVDWGQFIHSESVADDRDFFTVQEFWQTLNSAPSLKWKDDKAKEKMLILINFHDISTKLNSLVIEFDSINYSQNIENLMKPYAHLIIPGLAVRLELKTANQYHTELQSLLQIVADDDPRLALKRPKNTHQFSVEWGELRWKSNQYLQSFPTTDGDQRYADRSSFLMLQDWTNPELYEIGDAFNRTKKLKEMLATRPIIRVDGKEVWPYSFDIQFNKTSYSIAENELLPYDLQDKVYGVLTNPNEPSSVFFTLKNIKSKSGYVFDPLELNCFLGGYVEQNYASFDYLKRQPQSAKFTLNPPSPNPISDGNLRVEVVVPHGANVVLTVFDEKGKSRYRDSKDFPVGLAYFTVPAGMLEKGINYIFVSTPWGSRSATVQKK